MKNKNNNPRAFRQKSQEQDTDFKCQLKTIFQYLREHIATASMVSSATGIPHKNITRYKRDLEKAGQLWEIEKKTCKETGYKAWYITTDPEQAPITNQLYLF